jgi:hypothetical protein
VTGSLADWIVTFPFSQRVQVNNGVAPFTWSISSGSLPSGLALAPTANNVVFISGTPDTAETATFTVMVRDANNQSAARSYTVIVKHPVTARLEAVAGQVPANTVEIQGVSAGPFNPAEWLYNTLNWVPDVRVPMLAPQTSGPWQNIYAPWPLEQSSGWRLFYGGWDGTDTPNDRIYSGTTSDFLSLQSRHLVIDHGALQHVNNANVHQLPDGSMHMIYVFLPSSAGLDRVAYALSRDGVTWNGSPEPYTAQESDMVPVLNDPHYQSSDYNGGNVLLRDNGSWTLYYSKGAFGQGAGFVYRATSASPPIFNAAGTALFSSNYANDVKMYQVGGQNWYVMLLYHEAINVGEPPATFTYSISTDGVSFDHEQFLFGGVSAADKYPTTPAFVTQNGRILGVLYGADPRDFLNAENQIFARWLQKKVEITNSSGVTYPPRGGYGPDRQWFELPGSGTFTGTVTVYAEDGLTPMGSGPVTLAAGQAYRLVFQ